MIIKVSEFTIYLESVFNENFDPHSGKKQTTNAAPEENGKKPAFAAAVIAAQKKQNSVTWRASRIF